MTLMLRAAEISRGDAAGAAVAGVAPTLGLLSGREGRR